MGYFDQFGGRYVPETLISALDELDSAYARLKREKRFRDDLDYLLREYAGRPTPLYFARNLTNKCGGAKIFLKREDLLHGGATR